MQQEQQQVSSENIFKCNISCSPIFSRLFSILGIVASNFQFSILGIVASKGVVCRRYGRLHSTKGDPGATSRVPPPSACQNTVSYSKFRQNTVSYSKKFQNTVSYSKYSNLCSQMILSDYHFIFKTLCSQMTLSTLVLEA